MASTPLSREEQSSSLAKEFKVFNKGFVSNDKQLCMPPGTSSVCHLQILVPFFSHLLHGQKWLCFDICLRVWSYSSDMVCTEHSILCSVIFKVTTVTRLQLAGWLFGKSLYHKFAHLATCQVLWSQEESYGPENSFCAKRNALHHCREPHSYSSIGFALEKP